MKKLLLFFLFAGFFTNAQVLVKKNYHLMGSRFDISIVEKDSATAIIRIAEVADEISRIENLISEWRPETEISEVNRSAGIRPVKVSPEVFELTKHALYFSKISNGAFDISIAAMDKIWKFDGSMTEIPTEQAIKNSVKNVGYENIVLDSLRSTIFLAKPGMKIGFGSIGKGYAADRGREIMKKAGVKGGIVNASGDMSAWGTQPGGGIWKIGLQNPFKENKVVKILKINDKSVVTSGDYEKFVILDGRRFSHIINPKTGWPSTGLTSVTVAGPSAEFANGLSTSVMVLGKEKGLALLKKFPDYSAIIITDRGKVPKKRKALNPKGSFFVWLFLSQI